MTGGGDSATPERVVALARQRGLTIATAESLTAGLVASAIAGVPGASAVLRGGIVSYTSEVKASLLGVDRTLLAEVGAVDLQVGEQMAAGALEACGADVGVATTGVAGPEPHEGKDVGTVVVAVATRTSRAARELRFTGNRAEIREAACAAAVRMLVEAITLMPGGTKHFPE